MVLSIDPYDKYSINDHWTFPEGMVVQEWIDAKCWNYLPI